MEQIYFISSEQKYILTLASYAFIDKMHKIYFCLVHSMPKRWRGLNGPEVNLREFQLLPFTHNKQ